MFKILTLSFALLAGCYLPSPGIPSARPTPPADERPQCEDLGLESQFTIPGFPASRYFELHNYPSSMCLHGVTTRLEDFDGRLFVRSIDWSYSAWEFLEFAEITIDGHLWGWVYGDVPGWDPNFDVMPYVYSDTNSDGAHMDCVAFFISAGFYTPTKKIVLTTTTHLDLCPPE